MAKSLSATLTKSIEYLALPYQFPGHFWELNRAIFTQRELTHELTRLAPYRTWFKAQGIKTVLDIGAYIGSFAFAMRRILPDARIISFDPLDKNIRALNENLKGDPNFQVIQTALGDRNGTIDFWESDFTASSSALEMADTHKEHFPASSGNRRISVPLKTLDDCLADTRIEAPVLLKVDVQGFEKSVFEGGRKTLKKTDIIISEVSFRQLYKDQPLFEEIHDLLRQEGFVFAGLLDTLCSPLDGSILQADALFTRKAGK
jgi:FkbM family methyltransferase